MRNLKKIVALGLATTMALSSSMMAFAADTDFSSYPANDSENTKTIANWKAEDSDLFTTPDHEIQKGGSDEWKMTAGEQGIATFKNTSTTNKVTVKMQNDTDSLNGVTVKAYQILEITQSGQGEDGKTKYSYAFADPWCKDAVKSYFTETTDDDEALIARLQEINTNEEKAAFMNVLSKAITDSSIQAAATYAGNSDSDMSGVLDLSRQYKYTYDVASPKHEYSMGKGYYLITNTSDLTSTYTLATITGDTTINLKGEKPDFHKTGNDVIMKVGDTVTYTLETTMVNTKGDVNYKYIIYDIPEETMNIDTENIVVTVGGVTLEKTKDYDVEQSTFKDKDALDAADKTGIQLTFKFDSNSRLHNDAHVGEPVVVTYKATMLTNPDLGSENGNYNKAWLHYGGSETETSQWDVYSVGMKIHKTSQSNSPLAGAEFKLYQGTNGNGTPLKFKKDEVNKYYSYSTAVDATDTLITDQDGYIDIRGLDDNGSYYLVESNAPDGYLAVDDQTITVKATGDKGKDQFIELSATTTGTTSSTISADLNTGYIKLDIEDPAVGADLPATGGMGRTIVYVIGALTLIGGCTVLVITRSRKRTA